MKNINIILEGADGSGKSTTASHLNALLGWPVVKGSSFEQASEGNDYLFNKFYEFTKLDRVIFDRLYLSNLVYADLYKDYSILTPEQTKLIEDRVIKSNSKVFYFYADLDIVVNRVAKRGDDYVKIKMIEKIRDKYEEVLAQSDSDIVYIDTTRKHPSKVVIEVLKHAGITVNN